jgi:hypothetical protein
MRDVLHPNGEFIMAHHPRGQASFLCLYKPIQLFAVHKAVEFVSYVSTLLQLDETSVTAQHWSVRKQKVSGRWRCGGSRLCSQWAP